MDTVLAALAARRTGRPRLNRLTADNFYNLSPEVEEEWPGHTWTPEGGMAPIPPRPPGMPPADQPRPSTGPVPRNPNTFGVPDLGALLAPFLARNGGGDVADLDALAREIVTGQPNVTTESQPAGDGQWVGRRRGPMVPQLEPGEPEDRQPYARPIPGVLPDDRAYNPVLPEDQTMPSGVAEDRALAEAEAARAFRTPKTHEQAGTRPPGHLDRLTNEVQNWYLPWWLSYALGGELPPELQPRLPPLPDGPAPR